MSRPRYIFIEAAELPPGTRFDVTEATASRAVQVAYGGAADAPRHELGAPFMRSQNVVTGRCDHFRLAAEGEIHQRSAALAFEVTKSRDYEKLNEKRAERRTRCACGKVKRQKASACQDCLDKAAAEQRAREPEVKWSRDWRRDGWLCVFRNGEVILTPQMKKDGALVFAAPVERGAWAAHTDLFSAPWRMLNKAEVAKLMPLLDLIRRDCYCSSFPSSGCDFCNGTRLPDGAKEI